jgi:hypothetical protein
MRLVRGSVLLVAVVWGVTMAAGAQMVGDRVPLRFDVEHEHNGGKCSGTLTIDKWTFVYESIDRPQDNRTWKITQIDKVESKNPRELVLKTTESGASTLGQGRNYKFRVLGAGIDADVVAWMQDRVQ